MQHVVRAVGDREVNSIGSADVWAIQQLMLARHLSHATINHVTHNILRSFLRDLESIGLVDEDVFVRISRAKRLREVKTSACTDYTAEQRDRALAAYDGHWARALAHFLFLAGTRFSEAAGLRWRNLSRDCRTATIREGRVRKGRITPCKKERSQRTIDLCDDLAAELLRLERGAPDDFVFRGRHGKPVDFHTFRAQVWYPLQKAVGLPRMVPHGARHTYATQALTNGIPIAQVAAHLGNTERQVARTYSHVLPRYDQNIATGRAPQMMPPPVTTIVADRPRPMLRLVKG